MEWARSHSLLVAGLGAIIVFLSWVVTNTISNRLASTRATVDRVTTRDDLSHQLDRLRRGYREVKATLSRLDLLVSEMKPESIFSTFPEGNERNESTRRVYGLLQTAESAFFEHEDLQEVLYSLDSLAGTQELPLSLRARLDEAISDARRTLTIFNQMLVEWDQKRRRAIELIQRGQEDSQLFQEATSEFLSQAMPVHERMVRHRERLLPLHGEALGALVTRLNRLQRAHIVSERASWYLYVFGTFLIIAGNWLGGTS